MNAWTVVSSACRRSSGAPQSGTSSSCASRSPAPRARPSTAARPPPGCNDRCWGQLEEELRRSRRPARRWPRSGRSEFLRRPRLSGSIDGGNMKVIIAVSLFSSTPHATVGAARLVVGELSGRQPGLPAVLFQTSGSRRNLEHFQHVGVRLGDQPGVRRTTGGMASMTTTCIGPRPLARNSPPYLVGPVQRTALHTAPTSWPSCPARSHSVGDGSRGRRRSYGAHARTPHRQAGGRRTPAITPAGLILPEVQ